MPSFRAAFEFEDYLIQPRIETSVALHNYRLKGPQIRTLCNGDGYDFTKQGSPRTFLAEDVVRLSRQIHGGDIGVAALRKHINPGNTAREMHNCGLVVAEPIYTADWAMSDIRLLAARALVAYKHRIPTDLGESVAIFKMYVETDLSCIRTVIDEFELVDWLHRCADWAHPYPSKEKIRLSQLIPFDGTPVTLEMAQIAVETMELTLMSTEEERKEDEKRMQALSRWTWGRVRGVLEESTLLTPHDPDWPPEVVWRMMESLMGAETVHSIKQEAEARGPTDA
ncbi:hypothetical protein BGZ47_008033 [Haplosporangium gracile]|nr:hypothetical protein BGZ47_008033 [Haplosporangium gracile]